MKLTPEAIAGMIDFSVVRAEVDENELREFAANVKKWQFIGALRSKRYKYVKEEIKSVVKIAGNKTVKVILEVHYLSNDEIKRGCEFCINAGADFVKTSTGWAKTSATPENVALIKSFVGNAIRIKAAGGIKNLDTLLEM